MPNLGRIPLGNLEIVDARDLWPAAGPAARPRQFALLQGIAVHHDGVIMPPGDVNYSGATLDEDLARLEAIHNRSVDQGWGSFPYHLVVSPNGRCFYTLDVDFFGAHVARRNHELVGVCHMGLFNAAPPSDVQLCAAGRALLHLLRRTGVLATVRGHKDWALPDRPTSCPGDLWPSWKGRLLDLTSAALRVGRPS